MKYPGVASLFIGLGIFGPAGAQPQGPAPSPVPEPKVPAVEVIAVNECVKQVRKMLPAERFDAHVGLNGQIRPTGSNEALARFKSCMQQAGYPMD